MVINELLYGNSPSQIQIISLFFIHKEEEQGLLLEVKTGKEKTLIVPFLSVIKAIFDRYNVDIITSSSLLAKKDALDKNRFNKVFRLSLDYYEAKNYI